MTDLFKKAPNEVTRYFDSKTNQPTFDWRDIAPEEHAYAFTVAKSAGYDVLDDIRAELSLAIKDQVPFETFRQNLTPTLQKKGWWGRKVVIDHKSGFKQEVQLGSPRRLKTIYWANTRTAFAAGEWERTQRNKAFLPFLLYQRTLAGDPRQEHLSWVGIVLPVDHPFWATHYPPNGWGCECSVRQISKREAISLGWFEDQDEPLIIYEDWTNKRTGVVEKVPRGIDPGWAQNPGQNRARNVSDFLGDHIAAMPPARQKAAIADIVASPLLSAMVKQQAKGAWLPVSAIPQELANAAKLEPAIMRLSSSSLHHILVERSERQLSVDDLRSAIAVTTNPKALQLSKNGKSAVFFGVDNGVGWRVAVKIVRTAKEAEWWLTSFHRKTTREIDRIARRAAKDETFIK